MFSFSDSDVITISEMNVAIQNHKPKYRLKKVNKSSFTH